MKLKNTFVFNLLASFTLVVITVFNANAQDISTDKAVISAGQALFEENCTQCHSIDNKVIGPALKDAHKRNSVEWLKAFILNSQKVIASGDEYANKIYKEYNNTQMNSHDFNDDELNSVIAYIKDASENAPAPKQDVVVQAEPTGGSQESNSEVNPLLIGVIVILLLVLILVLIIVRKTLTNILKTKEGLTPEEEELVNSKTTLLDVLTADWFKVVVTIVVVVVVGKVAIDFVYGIGIQQGYAPKQPINFSHRIHAGSEADGGHEIDCNYCHTGVRKSKNANIPSPNICMNCHNENVVNAIKLDSDEIKKLNQYVKDGKPIEWVRIHNLPDLAYFNHSQHVKVGGVECQTCHGPIETMDVVEQHADLTMGWCINCHRETEVNAKGNAYYDELLKLHKEKTDEPMTVEDIGGMECSKCHY